MLIEQIDAIPKQYLFDSLKQKINWTHFQFDKTKTAKYIINLLDSNQMDSDGISIKTKSSNLKHFIMDGIDVQINNNIDVQVHIVKIGEIWNKDDHYKDFLIMIEYLDNIMFEIDIDKTDAEKICEKIIDVLEHVSDGDIKWALKNTFTSRECVVCLNKKQLICFQECNHSCCCKECFYKIIKSSNKCPLCRSLIV